MREGGRVRTGAVAIVGASVVAFGGAACSAGDSATTGVPVSSTSSSPATAKPTGTTTAPTTESGGAAPATVAASTGDGTRPNISSFTATSEGECKDGNLVGVISWSASPATATVTITYSGTFSDPKLGVPPVGPFANTGEIPLPPWVPCDDREHNLALTATNGGGQITVLTASVSASP